MSEQPEKDQQLIGKICQTLDAATESFDGQTRAKLARARDRALQEKANPRRLFPAWQTGAVMTAVALLLVLAVQQKNDTMVISKTESFEGLDVITDQADLEFYRDLEFYYWLSREENHAG